MQCVSKRDDKKKLNQDGGKKAIRELCQRLVDKKVKLTTNNAVEESGEKTKYGGMKHRTSGDEAASPLSSLLLEINYSNFLCAGNNVKDNKDLDFAAIVVESCVNNFTPVVDGCAESGGTFNGVCVSFTVLPFGFELAYLLVL